MFFIQKTCKKTKWRIGNHDFGNKACLSSKLKKLCKEQQGLCVASLNFPSFWSYHLSRNWWKKVYVCVYIYIYNLYNRQRSHWSMSKMYEKVHTINLVGGFKYLFMFNPIFGNDPNWPICFKQVGSTTNWIISICWCLYQILRRLRSHPQAGWWVGRGVSLVTLIPILGGGFKYPL